MPTGRSGTIAVAALAALMAGCATATDRQQAAGSSDGQQCFLPRMVNGFHAVDDDTVHVTVGVDRVYELTVFGACPMVDWSQRIGIRATAGGSWICQGQDADLLVPGVAGGVEECRVTMVRQLGEAEARALRQAGE